MLNNKELYRRNGKRIYIKQPRLEELEFVSRLWGDEETMRDIGGVFKFNKDKWEAFYKKMIYPSDGKNFYCLIYLNSGEPIGEVSFHGYDSATKVARFNIKIIANHRGRGYGEEAVRLLLEYYFIDFGGEIIVDNIYTEAGIKTAEKMNFTIGKPHNGEYNIRLSREVFLENKEANKKNVGILMFDGIDMAEFSLAYEVFSSVNELCSEKIFNIYDINFGTEVKTSRSYVVKNNNTNSDIPKIDILFIPSGHNIDNDDKILDYVKGILESCDYICVQGNGLMLLREYTLLNGLSIPKGQVDIMSEIEFNNGRIINKSYVDNGKIMLSSNIIGEVEMLLSLVCKVAGRKIGIKVGERIGVNRTL